MEALLDVKLENVQPTKLMEIRNGKYVVKGMLTYIIRRNLLRGENFVGIVTGRTRCQTKGSKVLMANGEWKNIEDVKIGDEVISPQKDGSNKFSKVIDTHKTQADSIYEIWNMRQNKKELLYKCADNHEIAFYNLRTKGHSKRIGRWEIEERTAKELSKLKNTIHRRTTLSSFQIQNFKDKQNCRIKPYSLGVWLGDGHFSSVKQKGRKSNCRQIGITTMCEDIMLEVAKEYPIMNTLKKRGTNAKTYKFSLYGEFGMLLIDYGLEGKKSGDKFIPKEALYSDIDYRRKLLAGLIDTDGYYKKEGYSYSICTKSRQLAEDIQWLVHSLGGRSSIRKIKKKIKSINFEGTYYDVTLYLGKQITNIPIQNKIKIRDKNSIYWYKSSNRQAFKVIEKDGEEVYGFTLDSSSHWYITDNWMITKNSGKSFTALRLCMEIDKNFTIDNVVFSTREFMELLHSGKLKPGSMILWDEAGVGIATRDWYSMLNKSLNYVLQTWGHQSIGLILTVPDFSMVDSQTRKLVNMHFKTMKLVRSRNITRLKPYFLTPMEKSETKRVRPRYDIGGKKLDIEYIEVKKPPTIMVNQYLKKKEAFTTRLNDSVLFDIKQVEGAKQQELNKTISDEDLLSKAWELLKNEVFVKNGKRRINVYIIKKRLKVTMSRATYIQDKLLEKATNDNYPPLESEDLYKELEDEKTEDRLNPDNLF